MESAENKELQLAFDFVKYTNRNIFLTGKAGTGKTTFLHDLKKSSPKRMIVVAPTGVAAINAGGVTIHSFFQLPFHPYVPTLYLQENIPVSHDEQRDKAGFKMSREKVNIIKSLDLLVIDEISMVRSDTLDAIDAALRRYKNRLLPFGGIQMLMIGDLHQLAPVVKEDDKEILGRYYDSPFFFGSRALKCTDYVTIELKHIYRQSDQEFIELLNKVRENRIDAGVLEQLNQRYIPDFDADQNGGYITLTTHNYQANTLNDSRLAKLPGNQRSFIATVTDEFPELSYPVPSELFLKRDAQVMFVKNDISGDKLFFNGKIGKVIDFEDEIIVVRCPGDDHPIRVEPAVWQNMRYTLDEETKEIGETVIGTFTQYPLRLAWAVTIHKSQGLTFDRAIIDARDAFAHGQVYVALSRCRTLGGLVLSSRIGQRSIIEDPVVSGFVSETGQNPPDGKLLEESKRAYRKMLLTELFDFTPLLRNVSYCLKVVNDHHGSLLGHPQQMFENVRSAINTDLIEVAEKFTPQLNALLIRATDDESDNRLQDRIMKAAEFFSVKLDSAMSNIPDRYSAETDNKVVRKAVSEALAKLRKEAATRSVCLNAVRSGFVISNYLDARAKSAIEDREAKSHPAKSKDDTSGIIKNPELLSLLKEWRKAKAREIDLPHYMILPQKTMVNLAGFVPGSYSALKQIKGMGKKKSEQFGEELLEIILSYCEKKGIPDNVAYPEQEIPKKVKGDSKKISLNLFNEGKSISEIAKERELSVTTIEGHLAYFVSTGLIPVNKFLSQEMTDLIMGHFEGKDDLTMGPVKAVLGEKVSWSDIRFAVNHIKFLRKTGTNV
jgi:tRNA uridine 5-carbamoylmethylation protein Kti12